MCAIVSWLVMQALYNDMNANGAAMAEGTAASSVTSAGTLAAVAVVDAVNSAMIG